MVERFQTGCGLVQCFKCCSYGHIAKHCRLSARCGHCSGLHETCECTIKEKSICANCTGKGLRSKEHKAWSESCPARKKAREALAARFGGRPPLYPQTVRPDHRPVVSLVVEKEPEKRGPGRPKGSKNRAVSQSRTRTLGEAMEVDSLAPAANMPAKRPRQATLSFGVDGQGGGAA
jgi:hypothetical protein